MDTRLGGTPERLTATDVGRQDGAAKGMAQEMTTTAHPTQPRSAGTDIASDGSTTHAGLAAWVAEVADLTTPDRISWVTGSDEEWTRLTDELVAAGTFTRLNPDIKPNSFHCASDPTDVARVEDRTFICSVDETDAGPTNNWMAPAEMKAIMTELYRGSHARPHHVRHPVRHGPPRRRAPDVRRRDHRLARTSSRPCGS